MMSYLSLVLLFFFFNDTATTEIYTLSLHDALPISRSPAARSPVSCERRRRSAHPKHHQSCFSRRRRRSPPDRSEEHTSELQSLAYLVCRLLLEKKKKISKLIPDFLTIHVVKATDQS